LGLLGGTPAKGTVSVQDLDGFGEAAVAPASSSVKPSDRWAPASPASRSRRPPERRVTATVQDGLWTLWWPAGSFTNSGDQQILAKTIDKATITWTTADGTTYTPSGDKISGTSGLQVPSGTASTGPTAK